MTKITVYSDPQGPACPASVSDPARALLTALRETGFGPEHRISVLASALAQELLASVSSREDEAILLALAKGLAESRHIQHRRAN
jgi:hypothetical protein